MKLYLLFIPASFLAYALVLSMHASGEVDYCYVENLRVLNQYRLYGHRSWRQDRLLLATNTLEEALQSAEKFGCKVK